MHPYIHTPPQTIGFIFLFLVFCYALVRGGQAERIGIILIGIDWIATPLLQNHDAFSHPQIGVFLLDGSLSVALLAMALTSNRWWPIWVTAFQLLELLMHAAMLIDHGVRPRAYWIGMEIWSYLMLIALAVGAWLEAPKRLPPQRPSRGLGA